MIEQIKSLRVQIDGLAQLTKELKPYKGMVMTELGVVNEQGVLNSNEIEKSYESLLLAKCWLGKILEELGNPTPYKKDGNRHTVEDIEPTADTLVNKGDLLPTDERKETFKGWSNMNHIERVDYLRQEINNIGEGVFEIDVALLNSKEYILTIFGYYGMHLQEARFWLGFDLSRIKGEDR